MTIDQLMKLCDRLNDSDCESVKTGIRRWLTLLHDNPGRQGQHLQRMLENNKKNDKAKRLIERLTTDHLGTERAVPALDVLSLYTILNQVTKDNEDETATL
jgi:hypothetical protein